ncbi:MAG: CinA family nicotinamide mononucleotide deamidase-related protein [Bacteroidales bacterium]|nr:CinA family nicotinamide mononucleotide deamidase-related protein [Bacteroidales bacterium]
MIKASVVTIGDEILIGQIVDTNSSHIARALEGAGVRIAGMYSIADSAQEIKSTLTALLTSCDIVITTGGLGPTKDDITKATLLKISGSKSYVEDAGQMEMVRKILHGRGLDVLPSNRAQAMVPDKAEVIVNKLGTAPIMVFRNVFGKGTLYSLPGVPHEAVGAIPDIVEDIKKHFSLSEIVHTNVMVYGIAESALSELIAPWEDSLPKDMHLAYLPNTLTGIRLRLSTYSDNTSDTIDRQKAQIAKLKGILGNKVYSDKDSNLETALGELLLQRGKTVSCAESCTGGEIAHMLTTVAGSSAYFLGSVTSYAVSVKEKVLGVAPEIIEKYGVVSGEVAAAMAEGVKKLTGSDYAVATTGLSGPTGDGINPVGTVWIGVTGPHGTIKEKYCYHNDRKRNIERFAASALNLLRLYILEDQ